MEKSFSEFKESFYSRVNDFSLFDAGRMNLLKVALDGLKVDYASKGKIRVFLFYPQPLISFFFFLQRVRLFIFPGKRPVRKDWRQQLGKSARGKQLIIDPGGRAVKNGNEIVSFYFGNILNAIGRENATVIVEGRKQQQPENDLHVLDYNISLAAVCGNTAREDKDQLQQLQKTYARIKSAGIFSKNELLNIRIAFQQFFIQYVFWRKVLKLIKPESVLLWPHYHREGCIAAFRENKIPVIELQHGLIAAQDIFYVLPPAVRAIEEKALFADEIWVYGKYWKEQLLKGAGYAESRIKICGYYPFAPQPSAETIQKLKNIFPGKKNILVTTQTYMDEYFCRYITFLSADLLSRDLPYGVLVKLHPAESPAKYEKIATLPNVRVIEENLHALFMASVIHITSFSTTIFDSLRFDLPNFSIWVEQYGDYISVLAEENVSMIIQMNENPVDFLQSVPERKNKEYYYDDYNTEMFRHLLTA